MKTKLAYVCVMLCFVLLTMAWTPPASGWCSGDLCGCGEANNACVAECNVENPCEGCPALMACVAACRREMKACSTACCAP